MESLAVTLGRLLIRYPLTASYIAACVVVVLLVGIYW